MPADPARVRDLFLAGAELPATGRAAYLAEACGADAELRAAVERLLAAHDQPASVLNPPAPASGTDEHIPQPDSGTILAGRYKLLEEIGAGGMGTVWMAQQTEPVKRLVAVKVIKAGMDSKAVLARFDAERQALALMEHPNIARALDAGSTPDGRPFFVMELVKGVPITQYCDAHKLTPRERLELFVPVCQAIQHAHTKGVIHRDIKPRNVLVAMYDDHPVPKVIDFGVAKATGQPLTEQTLHTGFGNVVGTPEYMSPEQATFNNLDVDTRSDVYSLGVLLYELLTGGPPISKKEMERVGLLEVLRVVREVEPPRPSTKLSTAEALPSLAASRGTEPKKLTGMLRNELDWIVMKALEKNRKRRYETANGFAADVLRYLSGEPVQAVPPSMSYRVRKFVRKNRGAVMAAGLVFLALTFGIAGTTWGLLRAERDRDTALKAAEQERLAKEEERRAKEREADERTKKIAEMDAAEKARNRTRDVLDAMYRQNLAKTHIEFGNAMGAQGKSAEMLEQYQKALAIQEKLASDFPDMSGYRRDLAQSHLMFGNLAATPGKAAKLDKAALKPSEREEHYRKALAILERLAEEEVSDEPVDREHFAKECSTIISYFTSSGDNTSAEVYYRKQVDAYEKLIKAFPLNRLYYSPLHSSYNGLAGALKNLGKREEAVELSRKALAVLDQHDMLSFYQLQEYDLLGRELIELGRRVEAEECCRKRLTLQEKLFADTPSSHNFGQIGDGHNRLGKLLADLGKPGEAQEHFRKSQVIAESLNSAKQGDAHRLKLKPDLDAAIACYKDALRVGPRVYEWHISLGHALKDKGDLDAALASFKEAIRLSPTNVALHFSLAAALKNKGDIDCAIACCKESVRLNPKDVQARIDLGRMLSELKSDYDGAIAEFKEVIRLDPKNGVPYNNIGYNLNLKGDYDAAIAYCKEAIPLEPLVANPHNHLAFALSRKGDYAGAIAEYKEALRLNPYYVEAHSGLVDVLNRKGDLDGLVAYYKETIRLNPLNVNAQIGLVEALRRKGDLDDVVAYYKEIIRLNPNIAEGLGNVLRAKGDIDVAIACSREAIRLNPTNANAHLTLGYTLSLQGDIEGAAACFKEAIRLQPNNSIAHDDLGYCLTEKGDLDGAIACCKEAIRLNPNFTNPHIRLGEIYSRMGDLDQAIACCKEAIRLDPKNTSANYSLRQAERWRELLARLPDVLAGRIKPPASEAGELAYLLGKQFQRRYLTAVQLYQRAFAEDPKLAEDKSVWHRYCAVCRAVLAASGKDLEMTVFGVEEWGCLTSQAHVWLQAELAYWSAQAKDRTNWPSVRTMLNHWKRDTDLIAIRDPAWLAAMPENDRTKWQALWSQVDAILASTHPTIAPPPRELRYLAAFQSYQRAFAVDPKLMEDPTTALRFNAACYAVMVATGRDVEMPTFGIEEWGYLTYQARVWLQADLANWSVLAKSPKNWPLVREALIRWKTERNLSAVRSQVCLLAMPPSDCKAWQAFWAEVDALLASSYPNPASNLLVNGSFEDGPAVGDFISLDQGSTAIKGWKVTRGQIDYLGTHWQNADGFRSLDLHGSPGYGGVEQTFKTKKGQRYLVMFSLAGSPGSNVPVKTIGVSAAGKMERFTFDSTGKTVRKMGWVTRAWEFTAVADETTLEIYTLETTDPVAGPALDDVWVIALQ
jgi:choice-of-anchor C domain-containing protein